MANEQMQMRAVGMAALRRREHAVQRYYNDVANNCRSDGFTLTVIPMTMLRHIGAVLKLSMRLALLALSSMSLADTDLGCSPRRTS